VQPGTDVRLVGTLEFGALVGLLGERALTAEAGAPRGGVKPAPQPAYSAPGIACLDAVGVEPDMPVRPGVAGSVGVHGMSFSGGRAVPDGKRIA